VTVLYRLDRTGRTPTEVVERLLTTECPSCGADWTVPGNGLPRGPGRAYLCTACGEMRAAQLVDEDGRAVSSPGWGLARERREAGCAMPADDGAGG
jgi:predicted RNA-binding Zn-ribbon protein involved in translation (DUF1610 family)